MFSYYPRPSHWQDEFSRAPFYTQYVPTKEPRSPPRRSVTSLPRSPRDSHTAKFKASNPTVFKTYNPEAQADFTSKEMITLVGPDPRYLDGHAIYQLDNILDPHVRMVRGAKIQVCSVGKVVLEFHLPRNVSAIDIDVTFAEKTLTIKVPHCLTATQECQVIDIIDGPLGDEYDEYGYYESLCAELNRKEQLERQRQKEEERQRYEALVKKELERKRREAAERAYIQRRYGQFDVFEPDRYFSSAFDRPAFSQLFFM